MTSRRRNPEFVQRVVALKFAGKSYSQIAERMNTTPSIINMAINAYTAGDTTMAEYQNRLAKNRGHGTWSQYTHSKEKIKKLVNGQDLPMREDPLSFDEITTMVDSGEATMIDRTGLREDLYRETLEIINWMPEEDKTLVYGHFFEGKSVFQIARERGQYRQNEHQKLDRILKFVRDVYKGKLVLNDDRKVHSGKLLLIHILERTPKKFRIGRSDLDIINELWASNRNSQRVTNRNMKNFFLPIYRCRADELSKRYFPRPVDKSIEEETPVNTEKL